MNRANERTQRLDLPTSNPSPGSEPDQAPLDGRYEVLNELGRGGMGIVYRARDRETGELVALKVLRHEIANDPTMTERFKNELRLARRITHKNVCRIYDFNRAGSTAYISMEFVEGESLRAHLDRVGKLSLSRTISLAQQICAGLAEAHAQGVVHRDLKPENVMLAHMGTVKLMDFGIARSLESSKTTTHTLIGTPYYMSPEQAQCKAVDQRADIYSLGLIMYECLTGRRPFSGDTPIAVALKQVSEAPIAPRKLMSSIPPATEAVILRCLEKDPARRFASVAVLEAALGARTQTSIPTQKRSRSLSKRLIIGALLTVIIIVAVRILPRSETLQIYTAADTARTVAPIPSKITKTPDGNTLSETTNSLLAQPINKLAPFDQNRLSHKKDEALHYEQERNEIAQSHAPSALNDLSSPRNETRMLRSWRNAAERGNIDAQYRLAQALEQGRGIVSDPVKAYALYSVAAVRGHKAAARGLERLSTQLSAQQLNEAQQLVQRWSARQAR